MWEWFKPDSFSKAVEDIFSGQKLPSKNKIKYYNVPCSFDIETSSFYQNKQKKNCMYIWMLGLNNDYVVMGRTWAEYDDAIAILIDKLGLGPAKHLVIYVHNLSYEMQYLRHRHKWESVFALEERKAVKAVTDTGIEFRCSYILSGESLSSLAAKLKTHTIKKMVGDLDYELIRHSGTPMTEEELGYCLNDVLIVMYYIQEKIDAGEKITKIPLTKTSYVRNYVRSECLPANNAGAWYRYRRLMNQLTITKDEYFLLMRAFQGGFTHANARHSCKIMKNVDSLDFTSSYPAVMVLEKFPMSKGFPLKLNSESDFRWYINHYCCIFDITFRDLNESTTADHPLSTSRCRDMECPIFDNGRIVAADSITTTMTNVDFEIMEKFYTWSSFTVSNFYYYYQGYLPTPFVKAILTLYKDKTELKGVKGREDDYALSKELLNSCYGMTVTSIIRDDILYEDDEWESVPADVDKKLEIYNNSKKRFLSYTWGVFVTAYARRNLFWGIKECGSDYIYSDTDSIKTLNYSNHKEWFAAYNYSIDYKINKAAKHHNLPIEMFAPYTIKSVKKTIGQWDWETADGPYIRFKTLGAKRYMVQEPDGSYELTVAGVNKKTAMSWMVGNYEDPMRSFNSDILIPAEHTGKATHTYIDEHIQGWVYDYLGNKGRYEEDSCIHLEASDYSLSLTRAYIEFLLNFEEV